MILFEKLYVILFNKENISTNDLDWAILFCFLYSFRCLTMLPPNWPWLFCSFSVQNTTKSTSSVVWKVWWDSPTSLTAKFLLSSKWLDQIRISSKVIWVYRFNYWKRTLFKFKFVLLNERNVRSYRRTCRSSSRSAPFCPRNGLNLDNDILPFLIFLTNISSS